MSDTHTIIRSADGLGAMWSEDRDFTGSVSADGEAGISVDLTEDHVRITHIKIVKGIITELETD